jgi:hypothetical protein
VGHTCVGGKGRRWRGGNRRHGSPRKRVSDVSRGGAPREPFASPQTGLVTNSAQQGTQPISTFDHEHGGVWGKPGRRHTCAYGTPYTYHVRRIRRRVTVRARAGDPFAALLPAVHPTGVWRATRASRVRTVRARPSAGQSMLPSPPPADRVISIGFGGGGRGGSRPADGTMPIEEHIHRLSHASRAGHSLELLSFGARRRSFGAHPADEASDPRDHPAAACPHSTSESEAIYHRDHRRFWWI